QFGGAGLVTADKVAWQSDTGDGQLQSPRDEQIDGAESERISAALVDDLVQVTAVRLVGVILVPLESQFFEQQSIDEGDGLLGSRARGQPFTESAGPTIKECRVGFAIDVRIPGLGEHAQSLLQFKVFPIPAAILEELLVPRLPGLVVEQLQC